MLGDYHSRCKGSDGGSVLEYSGRAARHSDGGLDGNE